MGHLKAVPDNPGFPGLEDYQRTIRGIHLYNGIGRAKREVDHLLKEAQADGYNRAEQFLLTAQESLAEAREEVK